jgi:hypothetical protein
MAYDQDNFLGLTREPDRSTGGDEFRFYAAGPDGPDNPSSDAGTHECLHIVPISGEEITLICPNQDRHTLYVTETLTTDGHWIVPAGPSPEDLVLSDRIAAMPPFPLFVQIHVQGQFTTAGGNNLCPPAYTGEALGVCLDPVDGTLILDAYSSTAAFEFGGELTTGGDAPAPLGFVDMDFAGMLRRPVDAGSYAGDPGNDAYRTLIPWDEFVADPSATIKAQAFDVNKLLVNNCGINVRLWWGLEPITSGHVSLVGCA